MSFSIKWSPVAKQEFVDLLRYVELKFGQPSVLKLLTKTDAILDNIAENPKLFPASEKQPDLRRAVISKQTSLFYRISQNEVQLLHFWDNRRDPATLEFAE